MRWNNLTGAVVDGDGDADERWTFSSPRSWKLLVAVEVQWAFPDDRTIIESREQFEGKNNRPLTDSSNINVTNIAGHWTKGPFGIMQYITSHQLLNNQIICNIGCLLGMSLKPTYHHTALEEACSVYVLSTTF
jgi:hypothetical protein